MPRRSGTTADPPPSRDRIRMAHVMTELVHGGTMRGHGRGYAEQGFDVTVVASPSDELERTVRSENLKVERVPMTSRISPLSDLVSLWRLWRVLRRGRFDLVTASTPKAGLLGGLAAWWAGVPRRVYLLRGLRLETTRGWTRRLLRACEQVACDCAEHVLCVSESLRQVAIAEGLVAPEHSSVLGEGSSNGIDWARYVPTPERCVAARSLRVKLGIPNSAPVIGFVGRRTRDKGIVELVEAFRLVRETLPAARLVLLGRDWANDPLPRRTVEQLRASPQIVRPGFIADPAAFYQLVDVVVLPSRREGFPNVVLEAAAAERPVVAFRATGTVDAVVNGQTGWLAAPGDVHALADRIIKLLSNGEMAQAMGHRARRRVVERFDAALVRQATIDFYRGLLRRPPREAPASDFAHDANGRRALVVIRKSQTRRTQRGGVNKHHPKRKF